MQITSAVGFAGGENPYGVLRIANSIAEVLDAMVPGDPPLGNRPIQIIRGDDGHSWPRVLWTADDYLANQYRIVLKTETGLWQQMAFQLAHELGHVKMGPARANLLIEVFAHAISLEALARLRVHWKAMPPFPWDRWETYADSLQTYRQNAVANVLSNLPESIRQEFAEQSQEEQEQRLGNARDEISSLPLVHPASRAWQIATADYLAHHVLTIHDRWHELLAIAMQTRPSATDELAFHDDLPLTSESTPTWLPEWI